MIDDDKRYPGKNGNGDEEANLVTQGLSFPGVDIYASWALGPGRDDFFPSRKQRNWLPMLFELKGISAENFARGFLHPEEPLIDEDQLNGEDKAKLKERYEFPIWRASIHVANVHLRPVEPLEDVGPSGDRTYVTALIYVGPNDPTRPSRRNFFGFLGGEDDRNAKLKDVFGRCVIGSPLDEQALPLFLNAAPDDSDATSDAIEFGPLPEVPGALAEEGMVVVAVIDDGIAFAHERFRNAPDKTRIEYAWIQAEFFMRVVPTGREITKADIDTELTNATSGGIVDEHEVYRHFGGEDFSRIRDLNRKGHKSTAQRASHGAHIMDVAAGYPMSEKRTDRPMICVQLPTEITADTSGYRLDPYLVMAVEYILRRADNIAACRCSGHLPVVINFSYGNSIGPHDGTSVIERYLDQRIRERSAQAPLRVVLPAGNSHLSRTHAQISFPPEDDPSVQEKALSWRVRPNDLTWSFMEIWLPRGKPDDRIKVELIAPKSLESPDWKVDLTELTAMDFNSGIQKAGPVDLIVGGGADRRTVGSIEYAYDDAANRGFFWLKLSPTDRIDPLTEPLAPAGLYTVKLTNIKFDANDLIHAWIQRDDTPFGYPTYGRQSYFDDPIYERYDDGGRPIEQDSVDSDVKRAGTISGLATGEETIVIGGVYRREMRAAEYAAGGPTYDADRVGPDASAVSDDTRAHRGILAAGTRSGSRVAIGGTSVAAPQIARWVADELAGGSNTGGDRTAVKNRAIIEETTPPERPPRPTHERGGAGRIIRPPVAPIDRFERFER